MMAKSGYITGSAQQPTNSALNASTPIAATQALPDRSQPDATGSSIGSANVPANVTGQPTLSELANAVGHNTTAINFVWTLMAGFLVFFMQAGFALVETGFTRSKNVAHTMGMNILIYALGVLGWYFCGFAIMFGGLTSLPTLDGFTGLNSEVAISILGHPFGLFGAHGFALTGAYDVGVFALFLFEVVFMDTAATIPTGAMAERWKFLAFCIYGLFIGTIIYPLFGNWVWGGGWLSQLGTNFGLGNGYVDFAGSTVVHMVGGTIGFVGAWMLGPRIGKYVNGKVRAIPPHSIPMAVLGSLILAFGWFGFNPGSTLAGTDLRISIVAVNTMLASVAGMTAATFWMWRVRSNKPDVSFMCNGLLAGLVAITGPCAFVNSQSAVFIGLVAGILVVGAVAVHGVCGAWGCLSLGLLADGTYGAGWNGVSGAVTGLLYGNPSQLAAQCIGVATCFVYTAAISLAIFTFIDKVVGLRVGSQTEVDGLDVPEMGAGGYDGGYGL
jgi:Amt family ammonium transporter